MALTAENIDGVLWISGSIDRNMESELEEQLNTYFKANRPPGAVLELSNVKYFASTSARVLINVAQRFSTASVKVKVRCSPAALQTLHLLGAKFILDLETCPKPNPVPTTSIPVTPPPTARAIAAAEMPTLSIPTLSDFDAPLDEPLVISAPVQAAPLPDLSSVNVRKEVGVQVDTGKRGQLEYYLREARARSGQPLAAFDEMLPDSAQILKELNYLGTYMFYLQGVEREVNCRLLGRVGNDWLRAEAYNSMRFIRIASIAWFDVMDIGKRADE